MLSNMLWLQFTQGWALFKAFSTGLNGNKAF